MKPQTAYLTDWTIGDDRCILDRDMLLIVKTVCYPASHLFEAELTTIHIAVKGVFVVVTVYANGTKLCEKCLAVPWLSNIDLLHTNFTPTGSIPDHPSRFRRLRL